MGIILKIKVQHDTRHTPKLRNMMQIFFTYACVYTSTCIHVYIHAHTHMCACVYVYEYICVYVHTHIRSKDRDGQNGGREEREEINKNTRELTHPLIHS